MENETAILIIESACYQHKQTKEAFSIAISALSKQIPKEIIINSDGYYPQCPSCLKDIGKYNNVKHCPNCSKALLWVHTNEQ